MKGNFKYQNISLIPSHPIFLYLPLQLYDRIASKVATPVRAPPSDAVQRARDAADALSELEPRRDTDHRDLQELRDLLCRPYFKVRRHNL